MTGRKIPLSAEIEDAVRARIAAPDVYVTAGLINAHAILLQGDELRALIRWTRTVLDHLQENLEPSQLALMLPGVRLLHKLEAEQAGHLGRKPAPDHALMLKRLGGLVLEANIRADGELPVPQHAGKLARHLQARGLAPGVLTVRMLRDARYQILAEIRELGRNAPDEKKQEEKTEEEKKAAEAEVVRLSYAAALNRGRADPKGADGWTVDTERLLALIVASARSQGALAEQRAGDEVEVEEVR